MLRFELAALVCGLALTSLAYQRRIVAREAQAATMAALDSAIVAAAPSDTAAGLSLTVQRLANQKRDAQMAAQRADPWGVALGGGAMLTLSALLGLGRLAVVAVLRRVRAPAVRHPTR